MKETINIILVEDNAPYRKAISSAFKRREDMELTHEFGSAEFAIRDLPKIQKKHAIHIILLDLSLPSMSGLESIPELRKRAPQTKIIIITQSNKESDVLSAIRLGASGYLLKSSSSEQLIEGIQYVHKGGATLDPSLAGFIIKQLNQTLTQIAPKHKLSKREAEILNLIADGVAQKEIASQLKISAYTVTEYIHNIYKKLEVPNAPSAVSKAHKLGLL